MAAGGCWLWVSDRESSIASGGSETWHGLGATVDGMSGTSVIRIVSEEEAVERSWSCAVQEFGDKPVCAPGEQ